MKLKIVNFKKFIMSTIVLLSIIFVTLTILSKSTYSHGEISCKVRYVARGETLWSIAKEQSSENEYYLNKDIRFIIEDLKEINNLKDCNLKVSQELKIPIFN